MCGIAGILSFHGASAQAELLNKMVRVLAHRGPDGEGTFIDGPVALGHRRLSIIDLDSGAQPMHSHDRRLTITYNGEIYNYRELRKELADHGYPFRTQSDTEVILALYERYGRDFLKLLNGMFAMALWDSERRLLLVARDRIGIKPLYYANVGGTFYFASEIKAICQVLPDGKKLDASAVNSYFTRQYIGGCGTIFSEIQKVAPGNLLQVDQNGVHEERYWNPHEIAADSREMTAAVEELHEHLDAAVTRHLVSDVPVGLFLSGGLDSSMLLSYAARANTELQTFSVGFGEDSELSETRFAKFLAQRYGTDHHEVHVGSDDALQYLPFLVEQLDEPLADYAILPTYVISRIAAERVKVVLSGEGADELFGGYRRYRYYALGDRLPAWLSRSFLSSDRLPGACVFREGGRRQLLTGHFLSDDELPAERAMRADRTATSATGHVNSMLYTDLRNWLVDDLLMKVDKMGMLASLEARVPYLDYKLVEFVLSTPGGLKVSTKDGKRLLKRLARDRLPPEILSRPKHGFTVPVGDWLAGALRERFHEVVFEGEHARDWLDLKFVRTLFRSHYEGRTGHGLQLWAIFIFCAWMEHHVRQH